MNVTKFTNEAGCDHAMGWDGAHLDGKHSTGHDMRVTVSRSMREPQFVRYQATVDGSDHVWGFVENVSRDQLDSQLPGIWKHCFEAPAKYRTAQPAQS